MYTSGGGSGGCSTSDPLFVDDVLPFPFQTCYTYHSI